MLPSVFKELSIRSTSSGTIVFAPGGARPGFGAPAAYNKKPGVERRALPSVPVFRQEWTEQLETRLSLSGIRIQPHLI